MASLESTVQEVVNGQTAVLQIGTITSAMSVTVPPLLDKLEKLHPKLTVHVKEMDSVEAIPTMEVGEFDIAFVRLDDETKSGIETISLAKDRLAVALLRDHKLNRNSHISITVLESEQVVMSSRKVSPAYLDMLISQCRKYGFSPRTLHKVRSIASQIAYVSLEQGVAMVPQSIAELAPDNVVVKSLTENIMVITSSMA